MKDPTDTAYNYGRRVARVVERLGEAIASLTLAAALLTLMFVSLGEMIGVPSFGRGFEGIIAFLIYNVPPFAMGLLMILAGRTSRAVMDASDNARRMLEIMQYGQK
jgi:hypothetical protein